MQNLRPASQNGTLVSRGGAPGGPSFRSTEEEKTPPNPLKNQLFNQGSAPRKQFDTSVFSNLLVLDNNNVNLARLYGLLKVNYSVLKPSLTQSKHLNAVQWIVALQRFFQNPGEDVPPLSNTVQLGFVTECLLQIYGADLAKPMESCKDILFKEKIMTEKDISSDDFSRRGLGSLFVSGFLMLLTTTFLESGARLQILPDANEKAVQNIIGYFQSKLPDIIKTYALHENQIFLDRQQPVANNDSCFGSDSNSNFCYIGPAPDSSSLGRDSLQGSQASGELLHGSVVISGHTSHVVGPVVGDCALGSIHILAALAGGQ